MYKGKLSMWILLIFVYLTHQLKLERYLLQKKNMYRYICTDTN